MWNVDALYYSKKSEMLKMFIFIILAIGEDVNYLSNDCFTNRLLKMDYTFEV